MNMMIESARKEPIMIAEKSIWLVPGRWAPNGKCSCALCRCMCITCQKTALFCECHD